jgi:pyridoxine 5-phosphate synthase
MTALSVNLNKVALLRNQRDIGIPSVTRAAEIAVAAGAHGITVHPRPDQRHIRSADVRELAALLRVEFNLEGNPFPEFLALVREVRPAQCTLVPDSPEQSTSDHGFVLVREGGATVDARRLRPIVADLRSAGIRVSLFIDPDREQIAAAAELGVSRVELYTEPFAKAFGSERERTVWSRYREAARTAQELDLGVNAGHDLSLLNLGRFCEIPGILEVSIGHALIADALEMGLDRAVRAYLDVLAKSAKRPD